MAIYHFVSCRYLMTPLTVFFSVHKNNIVNLIQNWKARSVM